MKIQSKLNNEQARVQGGAMCPGPPSKKRSSEQILSYFTYILLLFLAGSIIFSAIF